MQNFLLYKKERETFLNRGTKNKRWNQLLDGFSFESSTEAFEFSSGSKNATVLEGSIKTPSIRGKFVTARAEVDLFSLARDRPLGILKVSEALDVDADSEGFLEWAVETGEAEATVPDLFLNAPTLTVLWSFKPFFNFFRSSNGGEQFSDVKKEARRKSWGLPESGQ